jgi:predicted lipid carrier protein YhbT
MRAEETLEVVEQRFVGGALGDSLSGTVRIRFTGEQGLTWHIRMDRGLIAKTGDIDDADLEIEMPAECAIEVASGNCSVRDLLRRRRMTVRGDRGLMMKLALVLDL